MADGMTEIDLVVGSMITTRPEEDRDQYEEEREWLQDVQDLLRDEGIELDLLAQPGTEVWEGGIETFYDMYQLKRLAAHLERGDNVQVLLSEQNLDGEEVDDLLADIWDEEAQTRFPHLIKHQSEGGYYLPADFAEPIWVDYGEEDEDDGELAEEDSAVSFGSSVGLQRELTELEQLFQQGNVPTQHGAYRALQTLKTAAQQSVDNALPIIIW
jgi:hypothetical protein